MHNFSELDILKIAISMEEDGEKFYRKMYEDAQTDTEKQQIFLALANEEKNHAVFFNNIYQEMLQKTNHKEYELFDNDTIEMIKSLVSGLVLPEEDHLNKKQDFKELINNMVEQEYRSIKFYSSLLENTKNDNITIFLHHVIREEEQHVIKLKEMLYYNKTSVSIEEHIYFVENILNGMQDWVWLIDLEDNIIYANETMKEELGYYLVGRKCFDVIGRKAPCDDCVSRQAAKMRGSVQKEEKINGKIFSVMSSPLKNLNGEIQAVIEVLRDVTQSKLMEEQIKAQNKRFSDDLKIARKMQCGLLPKELNTDKITFTYTYKPCEAIGGDFFDVFEIDRTHIGIYIADVSGHGVPASMLTMFLRQTIRKDIISPAEVLEHLYKKYNESDFGTEIYITMFYAVIDIQNKKIKYANAGHNTLPILFNNDDMKHLNASGFPISNWVEEAEYKEYEMNFNHRDRLLLLTDGITDICSPSGQRYDMRYIEENIMNNKDKNIEEIKNIVIKDTYNFIYGEKLENNKIYDDITLLLLELYE